MPNINHDIDFVRLVLYSRKTLELVIFDHECTIYRFQLFFRKKYKFWKNRIISKSYVSITIYCIILKDGIIDNRCSRKLRISKQQTCLQCTQLNKKEQTYVQVWGLASVQKNINKQFTFQKIGSYKWWANRKCNLGFLELFWRYFWINWDLNFVLE